MSRVWGTKELQPCVTVNFNFYQLWQNPQSLSMWHTGKRCYSTSLSLQSAQKNKVALGIPLGPFWICIFRTYSPGCIAISTGKTWSQKLGVLLKDMFCSRPSSRSSSIHTLMTITFFYTRQKEGFCDVALLCKGLESSSHLNFPSSKITLGFFPNDNNLWLTNWVDFKCQGVRFTQFSNR